MRTPDGVRPFLMGENKMNNILLAVMLCVDLTHTQLPKNDFEGYSEALCVPVKEYRVIAEAARRNNCYGEDFIILLAIRRAENGGKGKEFGVKHKKAWNTDLDTQAGWCAATIVKTRMRWRAAGRPLDFITYLGNRYCPASIDFQGNINWKRNVKYFYERIER